MAIVTVHIDKLDHVLAGDPSGETVCGITVPWGTEWSDVTKPCPKCFPETVVPAKPKATKKG